MTISNVELAGRAKAGDTSAALVLAERLEKAGDYEVALQWYRMIAPVVPIANARIAALLISCETGLRVDSDALVEGLAFAKTAASQGVGYGHYLLDVLDRIAHGPQGRRTSLDNLHTAIKLGCPEARSVLASELSDVASPFYDAAASEAFALEARAAGDMSVCHVLALHARNKGRYEDAWALLEDGVVAGDPASMLVMALFYRFGDGRPKDAQKADEMEARARKTSRRL